MGQTGRVGCFQQVREKLWKKEAFFQLWPIIQVSPRRDEGIPPYRLLALPAAYYKKLCRERLIPVQEPNQRSGWPLKFDCGRSDLPYIFRITLPAKNLSPFYPIRPEKYVDKPRFIWYII